MAHLTCWSSRSSASRGQPCRQAARSAERSGMPGWRWSRVAECHDGDRLPRRQACDGCQEPRVDLAVSGLPAGGCWHRDLLIVQQLGSGRLAGPQLCADRDGGGGSSLRCDYPDGNPHVPGSEADDGSRLHKIRHRWAKQSTRRPPCSGTWCYSARGSASTRVGGKGARARGRQRRSWLWIAWALRKASAATVTVGFAVAAEGNTLLPTMKRFLLSCDRHSLSTTESLDLDPMIVVPMMCPEPESDWLSAWRWKSTAPIASKIRACTCTAARNAPRA